MNPNLGNDGAATGPDPLPLAGRVEQLENHLALVRLLTDRGVLPRVVEEPVPSAPRLKITSDSATLACATGAAGLALGSLGH